MILHMRILATFCGAFVVVTGSWLAMRQNWRWAWSANTTGLALFVLLALSPVRSAPLAAPVPPYVAAWPEQFVHRTDAKCRWARQSIRPENIIPFPNLEAATRCRFDLCPDCFGELTVHRATEKPAAALSAAPEGDWTLAGTSP